MTLVNVAGIVLGSLMGLLWKQPFSVARQQQIKAILAAFTVAAGLRLVWLSLNGKPGQIARQLIIMLLAMTAGKILGQLLRLQKLSNRVGNFAGVQFRAAAAGGKTDWNAAFLTGAAVFCGGALPVLGAVQAGLTDYWQTLAIKTVIDTLAAMAFAQVLGWGMIVSAVAVFAYQGTFARAAEALAPWLVANGLTDLTDSINAVGGMLVFCVALVIFELKKIELADYLPALIIAPLLTWWWR